MDLAALCDSYVELTFVPINVIWLFFRVIKHLSATLRSPPPSTLHPFIVVLTMPVKII